MNASDLLEEWRSRVERIQHAHYLSARRYEHMHLWLGLPTIILATVVGTSVFATLSQTSQLAGYKWLQIIVGLLSVASAILAALQTFLRYSELAERHRIAGARFIGLKREIELLRLKALASNEGLDEAMKSLAARWVEQQEDSPNIPGKIWEWVKSQTPIHEPELSRLPPNTNA